MQILPKLSFKSLALGAAVALVISTVRIRPHGRRAVSQPSLRSAAIGSSAAAWRAG
jgi:hypothetical protein